MNRILKHIDLIAALILLIGFGPGWTIQAALWLFRDHITPESLQWALANLFWAGVWMGLYMIRIVVHSIESSFEPDNDWFLLEHRYRNHLDQTHDNPIMRNEVKAIWIEFRKKAKNWQTRLFLMNQLKVNWFRAWRIAYEEATFVIYAIVFLTVLPYTRHAPDPVIAMIGLSIAVWAVYHFQQTLSIVFLGTVADATPPRPQPPFAIPPMLLEDVPATPFHVKLQRAIAEFRAIPRRKKIAMAVAIVLANVFMVFVLGSLLHLTEVAATRPSLDQILIAALPFLGCIAFIIVLMAVTPKKPNPTVELLNVAQEDH